MSVLSENGQTAPWYISYCSLLFTFSCVHLLSCVFSSVQYRQRTLLAPGMSSLAMWIFFSQQSETEMKCKSFKSSFFKKSKSFNFSENFWFLLLQICLSLLFQEEWVIHEPDLKQTCILEAKSNEAQHSSVEPQPSRGMGKKQMPKFYVGETVIFMQQSVSETPFIVVSEITKMLSSRWFLK